MDAPHESLVLIPFGSEFLALTHEEFEQARARGRELMPATSPPTDTPADRILDADGMASMTGVPASWFLEAARRGDIPALRFGKYCRFSVGDVLATLTVTRGKVTKLRRTA
jgi:hypothetical protein